MRRRCSNNDVHEVARPSGALNEKEIEEIRQAYRDGCKGDILIGLRGEKRVITMLLPAQADKALLLICRAKMKEIGCDNCIHINTGHGSSSKMQTHVQ